MVSVTVGCENRCGYFWEVRDCFCVNGREVMGLFLEELRFMQGCECMNV